MQNSLLSDRCRGVTLEPFYPLLRNSEERERVRTGLQLEENKLLELEDLKSNFPSGVSKEPMKVPKGECLL